MEGSRKPQVQGNAWDEDGAFWSLPSLQDLGICQLIYLHTQRTTSGSHITFKAPESPKYKGMHGMKMPPREEDGYVGL
jgi:hypothetical protein